MAFHELSSNNPINSDKYSHKSLKMAFTRPDLV